MVSTSRSGDCVHGSLEFLCLKVSSLACCLSAIHCNILRVAAGTSRAAAFLRARRALEGSHKFTMGANVERAQISNANLQSHVHHGRNKKRTTAQAATVDNRAPTPQQLEEKEQAAVAPATTTKMPSSPDLLLLLALLLGRCRPAVGRSALSVDETGPAAGRLRRL